MKNLLYVSNCLRVKKIEIVSFCNSVGYEIKNDNEAKISEEMFEKIKGHYGESKRKESTKSIVNSSSIIIDKEIEKKATNAVQEACDKNCNTFKKTLDSMQNSLNSNEKRFFSIEKYIKNEVCDLNRIQQKHENDHKKMLDQIKSVELENMRVKKELTDLKTKNTFNLQVVNNKKTIDVGLVHKQFKDLLKIVSTKLNVYISGPAGSGKTTAAEKCAKALDVPFYFTGAIENGYKLTGYMDAQGKYVTTEFRKAYENGGLFLFDEIDASFPQAILTFNAALSNGYMDFPDKQVKQHNDFYCIAAANTIGLGADRQYVGRNQLDAATLDRFVFVNWEYDEELEQKRSENKDWCIYVQKVRTVISDLSIRHIVSSRAIIFGAKLLSVGINRKDVENMVLWKGLDDSTITKIKERV